MLARVPQSPHESPVVLYVDDDPNDLFFVQRAFEQRRPDVDFRSMQRGEDAMDYLAAAVAHRFGTPLPHVVILDLKMPVPDGFDILRWIRNHPELPELPVVILSSSDCPRDSEQAAAMGATHYMVKDAAFSEIPDQIAPWLPPADQITRRRAPLRDTLYFGLGSG